MSHALRKMVCNYIILVLGMEKSEKLDYIKIRKKTKIRLRDFGATYELAVEQLLDYWDEHHKK